MENCQQKKSFAVCYKTFRRKFIDKSILNEKNSNSKTVEYKFAILENFWCKSDDKQNFLLKKFCCIYSRREIIKKNTFQRKNFQLKNFNSKTVNKKIGNFCDSSDKKIENKQNFLLKKSIAALDEKLSTKQWSSTQKLSNFLLFFWQKNWEQTLTMRNYLQNNVRQNC